MEGFVAKRDLHFFIMQAFNFSYLIFIAFYHRKLTGLKVVFLLFSIVGSYFPSYYKQSTIARHKQANKNLLRNRNSRKCLIPEETS